MPEIDFQALQQEIQLLRKELEEHRPESVVYDSRRDPSEREHFDKVYEALRASNRQHVNALTQRQQHKQAHSREMTMHADALAGGQHELMQALIAIQTWDFHNGQQGDERWQQMVSFMNAMQRFADEVMTYLAQKDPKLFKDSGN